MSNLTKTEEIFFKRVALKLMQMQIDETNFDAYTAKAMQQVLDDDKRIFKTVFNSNEIESATIKTLSTEIWTDLRNQIVVS